MNRNHIFFALALGLVSLGWLLYDVFRIFANLPEVLSIASVGLSMAIGYPFILLFHLVSFWVLLRHRMTLRNLGVFSSFLLCLGIVSLFSIAVEKVMFDELAHQMPFWHWGLFAAQGLATVIKVMAVMLMGEFLILAGAYAVNILFAVLMLVFLIRVLKIKERQQIDPAMSEDILFTSAHGMGVVTGLLGLFISLSVILNEVAVSKFWIAIPFYILFTLPYVIAAALWLTVKMKQNIACWYDEKQWNDMLKSSFATLLLSIPGLAALLYIPVSLHFYWFPYYLSLILTLFSAGTIYFNRKA